MRVGRIDRAPLGSAPSWQRCAPSAGLHAFSRTGRTNKLWDLAKTGLCLQNFVFRLPFRMLPALSGGPTSTTHAEDNREMPHPCTA